MTSRELTSGFDFWSRGHLRMAVMHLHIKYGIQISLSSPELLTFSRNSRWRPPPSWIFRLCKFGYSCVLTVWYLCSVPNGVKIYALVSGYWDRRTYASDVHLMTSREITSGFDFWSNGHLRMAVLHLPVKFGADIVIQCGVIDILPKLKMAAAAILDLLGGHGTTHEGTLVVRTPC